MTTFKQLRKRAEKAIKSKYTPNSVKESLIKEILGKCAACAVEGIEEQAVHDRFGKPLCQKCNDYIQKKIDERNAQKKKQEEKSSNQKEDEQKTTE